MAIDWMAGYRSSWRVYRVDRETWADSTTVEGVMDASIENTCDEDAPLLQKGSMTIDADPWTDFEEGYYRIVMVAEQDGTRERVDVATLLCSSASGDENRGVDELTVQGRSVLYPASRAELEVGSYAPAGVDGVEYVVGLLTSCINAPVVSEGSFTLDEHLVFDVGTKVLNAAWSVLDAGGYVMQIHGDGVVHVVPKPTISVMSLDRAHARLLHPGVHHELDYSEVPNRFVASENGVEAEAVNDDPTSVTSTVYRGWRSDERDTAPKRVNGETLAAYCNRRLEELSTVTDSRTYSREWWPGVHPYDIVRGSMATVGFDGELRVVSQSVTCGRGLTVEEESNREVATWRA